MCCHWHWHMSGQDDWNEVQNDFSGHVMPLAPIVASHDGLSIVKGTTTFLRSRQLKWGAIWLFWSCHNGHWHHMIPLVLVSHDAYSIINDIIIFLGQDDRSKVSHDFLGHTLALALVSASYDANSIVKATIALLRSRLSKWSTTWHFGHVTPLALASHDADDTVNSIITFFCVKMFS